MFLWHDTRSRSSPSTWTQLHFPYDTFLQPSPLPFLFLHKLGENNLLCMASSLTVENNSYCIWWSSNFRKKGVRLPIPLTNHKSIDSQNILTFYIHAAFLVLITYTSYFPLISSKKSLLIIHPIEHPSWKKNNFWRTLHEFSLCSLLWRERTFLTLNCIMYPGCIMSSLEDRMLCVLSFFLFGQ